ncbi:unnamed protein product, partial [Allacma fusca]
RAGEFQENDQIWVRTHPLSDASRKFAKKLAPLWEGPYRISKKLSEVTYEISDENGRFMGRQHVSNLKVYVPREQIQPQLNDDSQTETHKVLENSKDKNSRPIRKQRFDYRQQLGHRVPNCSFQGGCVTM